jgi:hypothetical protein
VKRADSEQKTKKTPGVGNIESITEFDRRPFSFLKCGNLPYSTLLRPP